MYTRANAVGGVLPEHWICSHSQDFRVQRPKPCALLFLLECAYGNVSQPCVPCAPVLSLTVLCVYCMSSGALQQRGPCRGAAHTRGASPKRRPSHPQHSPGHPVRRYSAPLPGRHRVRRARSRCVCCWGHVSALLGVQHAVIEDGVWCAKGGRGTGRQGVKAASHPW